MTADIRSAFDRAWKKIKSFFALRSITSKMILAFAICGVLLLLAIQLSVSGILRNQEEKLIAEREETDIQYLEDYLSSGDWQIIGNSLYKGDVLIGDGTEENANIEPFVELEEKTGSFFYTFISGRYISEAVRREVRSRTDEISSFIRVAGSTKDVNGNSIVGTYLTKSVSDSLLATDKYSGRTNVLGRDFFCLYKNLRDSNNRIVGCIVVGRSMEQLNDQVHSANVQTFWIVMLALVLAITGMMVIIFRWIKALNRTKEYLKQIGTGVFPERPLEMHTKDELEEVADSINEMTVSLKEKERIGAELSLATDIQAHMLPSIFPPFPEHDEIDIYATMDPAKEVGGDFYDFFMLDESHLAVVVADVSGKGVPAALFMVIAKTLIKNHAQSGLAPEEVFTKVNQMLCEGNDAALFVTAWMGVLDFETGVLRYVNAGHNPPLIKLGDGGFEYLRSKAAFVLAGIDGMRYTSSELTMKPGDRLVLYTDGVTEATDSKNELYGEERLKSYLNGHVGDDVIGLLHGLREDMNLFVGDAEQFDDITMLALDFRNLKKTSNAVVREFDAKEEELSNVIAFAEEELEKADCSPKASMQLCMAIEELFINIARYSGSEKMTLSIENTDGSAVIRLCDRGLPFNPLAKSDPDISLSAEERTVGGLGIFMVKKTMDDMNYKYENGQNVMTIVKKIG